MESNKKIFFKSRKFKMFLVFLLVLVIASLVVGYYYSRNYKFNSIVTSANNYFNNDKFDDAENYYNKALEYKEDKNIKEKIELCKNMRFSLATFNDGNKLFEEKSYLFANEAYKKVIKQDTKRYKLAQDKIKESLTLYVQYAIQQSNDLANKGRLEDALDKLNLLLSLYPNDETAKSLLAQYKDKQQQEIDASNKKMEDIKREAELSKINSIKISKLYTSPPNSAGGVDLHVVWTNKANKVIKYITFEVVPYNAVGDAQYCQIKAISNYRAKVTGPINSGQTYGDNYLWECAWYNNSIKTARLVQVDIEYMDGSTVTVDSSLISKIMN